MASRLYDSQSRPWSRVLWFVRRFGPAELVRKPLRTLFAPLIIPRLAPASFKWDGQTLPLFDHRYNMTWANERAVEIPIARALLERFRDDRVLEVGNVLSHYVETSHTIVDKFESGPGVVNVDITDYSTEERFDLVLSVSTFEHIGFDDETPAAADSNNLERKSRTRIEEAIATCRRLLDDDARLVITVPLGYNPALDRMIAENDAGAARANFLHRTGARRWVETDRAAALSCRYGRPYPYANAVMIASYGPVRSTADAREGSA